MNVKVSPEQPEAGRDEAVVDEADFFGCPGYRATYRGKNLLFDPDKETCEFFAEAFNAGLKAAAGRDEYHRCGKNIRRHKVSECRPQAQEAVRAAGLYPLYNELIDLIGECAVTDEMSCGVCRAEEGDDHHDSCPIGIIEEWAHNNLARESPPANAEAVDLLRELAKDFEALAKKEELDPSRTAEEVDENWRETMLNLRAGIPAKFLAQHGGRGDA